MLRNKMFQNTMYCLTVPVLYGELKHSGNMASVQPLHFACCIRFTAFATFIDLSAVTVNCNTAARKPEHYK